MATKKYYLSSAVCFSALSNYWRANCEDIHPTLRKLNLCYRHRPQLIAAMESLSNPKPSVQMDPVEARINEVQLKLLNSALQALDQSQKTDWQEAEKIAQFFLAIRKHDPLQGVEAIYSKIPDSLKGAVELGFDGLNQISFRLLEKLLYQSDEKKDKSQSAVLHFQEFDSDHFNSLQPSKSKSLKIPWHFSDPRYDQIFAMETKPQSTAQIRRLLGVKLADASSMEKLFTTKPGKNSAKWTGKKIRLRHFGHACVLLQAQGKSVLIDPVVPSVPKNSDVDRFSFEHLPAQLDYVLITHSHSDHFDISTLLRIRHRTKFILVPRSSGRDWDISLKNILLDLGFKNVVELDSFEDLQVLGNFSITAIPFWGEHGDLLFAKSCWLIRIGQQKMLFCADSRHLDSKVWNQMHLIYGDIQSVFLGCCYAGARYHRYYPHLFNWHPEKEMPQDKTRLTNGPDAEEVWKIVKQIGAKRIFIYALGLEPWLSHIIGDAHKGYLEESNKLLNFAKNSAGTEARRLESRDECFI